MVLLYPLCVLSQITNQPYNVLLANSKPATHVIGQYVDQNGANRVCRVRAELSDAITVRVFCSLLEVMNNVMHLLHT